jgi:hypothetical protein
MEPLLHCRKVHSANQKYKHINTEQLWKPELFKNEHVITLTLIAKCLQVIPTNYTQNIITLLGNHYYTTAQYLIILLQHIYVRNLCDYRLLTSQLQTWQIVETSFINLNKYMSRYNVIILNAKIKCVFKRPHTIRLLAQYHLSLTTLPHLAKDHQWCETTENL